MRIVYLHGLKGKASNSKVDFLKDRGHIVMSPQIDYLNKNSFNDILTTSKSFMPDLIMGSSMGGFFALEIGKHLDVPVILFNPALHSRPFEPNVDTSGKYKPEIYLALGMNDYVIDPLKTIKEFSNNLVTTLKGNHNHKTPIEFFTKVFQNVRFFLYA